jgi:protein sidekick
LNLLSSLVPEQSPTNLNVESESATSISIKWEPPSPNKTNGIILGYKVKYIFFNLIKF